MFFSKARRGMRHAALALVALCAISAPAFLAAQPALASTGGSDAPTPYTVDLNGITLPEGATFKDNGHINVETTSGKKTNTHFEAKCITRTDAEGDEGVTRCRSADRQELRTVVGTWYRH